MKLAWIVLVVAAACGGGKQYTVSFVNQTPRGIAQVFVFPPGSTNHGTSRGKIAPQGTLSVNVKGGGLEVLAISDRVELDDHKHETKQASSTIEVHGPVQVLFHDSDQPGPAQSQKSVFDVTFEVTKPPVTPEPDSAPDAPPPAP